jgi:transposase
MIIDWSKVQIFVKPGHTDMRKQINGLSIIVEEELNINLFKENMFIFCNKKRRRLKILYWDRNGFCLWLKRLEKERFPWPRNKEEAEEISYDELKMLLDGIDFFNAHKKLTYNSVL